MKLCYLIPEWPGQSHVWAWREINHLRDLGVEVDIFSTRKPSVVGRHAFATTAINQTEYLWPLSIFRMLKSVIWAMTHNPLGFVSCIRLGLFMPVHGKRPWKSVLPLLVPACLFAQLIRNKRINHLHTPFPGNCAILCMYVMRLTGRPFSLTVVSEFEDWGGAMKEKFEEASFVTVVNSLMIDIMKNEYPSISPDRYSITRHGVDTRKWSPSNKNSVLESQPKRILSIGRLTSSKGFADLIQALALVKAQKMPFELRIAGEGPERERLGKLILHLDLAQEVVLLGSLSEDECLAEARAADIFASATHSEGFPVVLQEAMAVELASICTTAGGVPDIITNEVNGLLVSPHDVFAMSEAIVRLLKDDELRNRLAKAGRRTVVEQFDSSIGAKKLARLFESNPNP